MAQDIVESADGTHTRYVSLNDVSLSVSIRECSRITVSHDCISSDKISKKHRSNDHSSGAPVLPFHVGDPGLCPPTTPRYPI